MTTPIDWNAGWFDEWFTPPGTGTASLFPTEILSQKVRVISAVRDRSRVGMAIRARAGVATKITDSVETT